jgi:hypothetical protein
MSHSCPQEISLTSYEIDHIYSCGSRSDRYSHLIRYRFKSLYIIVFTKKIQGRAITFLYFNHLLCRVENSYTLNYQIGENDLSNNLKFFDKFCRALPLNYRVKTLGHSYFRYCSLLSFTVCCSVLITVHAGSAKQETSRIAGK